MNVTLKAKHFYYISHFIKGWPAKDSVALINKIKAATANGTAALSSDITIVSTPVALTKIYSSLTNEPEGRSSAINKEMSEELAPQMTAGVIANDPDWIYVSDAINNIKLMQETRIIEYTTSGQSFLFNS